MTRPLFVLITLLLIIACGPATDQHSQEDGTAESQIDTNSAVTTDPEDQAAEASPAVALDTEGLRLVDPQSGSTRPVAFGMDRLTLIDIIENSLGDPADSGMNSECGAGPLAFASWTDGLTLWFSQDAFTGWAVDGRAAGAENYTTMAGIGTGSTRAELEEAYAVTVENSTLGVEFATKNLFGILDGSGPNARITNLWSGVSCNFR